MQTAPSHDLLVHVRTVISMILGLGVARLLNGLAGFVQHPKKERLWWLHLCWAAYMLVSVIAYWWWQFQLAQAPVLTFEVYAFLIAYTAMLFLLCSLLFPTDMSGYDGFGDYFMARRAWFFGLLGATYLMDVVDSGLKGAEHLAKLGPEYPVRIAVLAALCLTACFVRNLRFHAVFALGGLIYLVSYIARYYGSLS